MTDQEFNAYQAAYSRGYRDARNGAPYNVASEDIPLRKQGYSDGWSHYLDTH